MKIIYKILIGLTLAAGIAIAQKPIETLTAPEAAVMREKIIGNGTLTLNKLAAGGATANQTLTFNGTQWIPGNATAGSGNITNSSVNAAISDNATATLRASKALGWDQLLGPRFKTWRFANRMANKVDMEGYGVKVVNLGDSITPDFTQWTHARFGYGGRQIGVADPIFPDYAAHPRGTVQPITSGNGLEITTNLGFNSVGVGYISSNASGKFKVQVKVDGAGDWVDLTGVWVIAGKPLRTSLLAGSTSVSFTDPTFPKPGMYIRNIAGNTQLQGNTTIDTANAGGIKSWLRDSGGANRGSGMTPVPTGPDAVPYTVSPTGGSGTGAQFTVNIASDGTAGSIAVVNAGQNYAVGDILTFPAAQVGGTGTGFTIEVASLLPRLSLPAASTVSITTTVVGYNDSGSDEGFGVLNTAGTVTPSGSNTTAKPALSFIPLNSSMLVGAHTIRLFVTDGSVTFTDVIIDAGAFSANLLASSKQGGMSFAWGRGGTDIGHHLSTPQDTWERYLGVVDPEIITYRAWDGPDISSSWPTYAGRLMAAAPNATLVVFGSHQGAGFSDRSDPIWDGYDDYMRDWCAKTDGAVFIDLRASFPDAFVQDPSSVDRMIQSSTNGHYYTQHATPWMGALMDDAFLPAMRVTGVMDAKDSSRLLPGNFSEIRTFDARGTAQPPGNQVFNFTSRYGLANGVLARGQEATFSNTFPFMNSSAGFIRRVAADSGSTANCLGLVSNGAIIAQFSQLRGGYWDINGISNNSTKAASGWRFKGPSSLSAGPAMALESDKSTPVRATLELSVGADNTTVGTPHTEFNTDGSINMHGVITKTATTASGNATVLISDTSGLETGMAIHANRVPTGRTISSIDPNVSVTLNTGTSITTGANEQVLFTKANTFLKITPVSVPGYTLSSNTTIGSNIVTPTTTDFLSEGMTVTGAGMPSATTVTSISSNGSLTLSNNATSGTGAGVNLTYRDAHRITLPWTRVAGTGAQSRVIGVIPSYGNATNAEAVLGNGEVYYDEETSKVKVKLP